MDLNSISSFCGVVNSGGIQVIEYAPIHWINPDSFIPLVDTNYNWANTITFSTGNWLQLPILRTNELWNEEEENDAGRPFYEQVVSGITPKMRPEVSQEFQKMSLRLFVIKLTDQNNNTWLIGTLTDPLRFQAQATGGRRGGLNQYQISFRGQTRQRAYGYVPVL
jgi:hypothetical protein